MARVLSICGPTLCIALGALGALGIGGTAWGDKPKIAVLGLEAPIGPSGASDPGALVVAREVTRDLRQRVQARTSPYETAPNSDKELSDEKLLMSCETEAPDCMVVIAAGLASDVLLYGRVEKKTGSFRVSLKLLDVKRRSIQTVVDDLPVGGQVSGTSRRLYRRLIGDGPSGNGTLIVKARAETGGAIRLGTVLIDSEPWGQVVGGRATFTEVSDGRHAVAIDAPGFRRFEEIVTVRGGEPATVDAVLHPLPGQRRPGPPDGVPRSERSALWTWSLVGGVAIVVGGFGFAGYSYVRQQEQLPDVGVKINSDRCDDSDMKLRADFGDQIKVPVYRQACTSTSHIYNGFYVAGAGAAIAIVSLIMISRDPAPADSAAGRGKKPSLAVVPIVAPGVAGAQLTLAW
jgi:hypothetical protein